MKKNDIDGDLVRYLAQLLDETGLSDLEYEKGDARIRVGKHLSPAQGGVLIAPQAVPAAANATPAAAPAAAAPAVVEGTPVPSPMVGTVYLGADPNSPPFVKVGDKVKKGQTLLIIEAMKVMNPIPSPADGVVKEIKAKNGQPVEFGETLVVL